MIALKIIGIIAFALVGLICLLGIIFSLPGTWAILVLAIIAGAITGFEKITLTVLLILLGLALLGELIEFLVGYLGARIKGASRGASLCAVVMSFICAIALSGTPPVLGPLLGAFLGAFLGGMLAEYYLRRKWNQAYQAGLASVFGRVSAILSKIAVGVGMMVVSIYYLI